MKKLISSTLLLVVIASFFNAYALDPKKETSVSKSAKVEVYYFHYSRRCVTCRAVETETQAALAALYPSQTKNGLITFKSVNLDEKANEPQAIKCKAEGQSLLVISGNKRFDLTDKGFMYAKSAPQKWRAELKKIIDPII